MGHGRASISVDRIAATSHTIAGVANSLFSRKPIAALVAEGEDPKGLRRELGAGDLIMLAIGAVIGAGIFSSIGTAAAGETMRIAGNGRGPSASRRTTAFGRVCAARSAMSETRRALTPGMSPATSAAYSPRTCSRPTRAPAKGPS